MAKIKIDVFKRSTSSEKFIQLEPTGIRVVTSKKLHKDVLAPAVFVDSGARKEEMESEYLKVLLEKISKQLKEGESIEYFKDKFELGGMFEKENNIPRNTYETEAKL